jgi:hypothetical protein
MTLEGTAKLTVAVAGSAFAIGYLEDKGYGAFIMSKFKIVNRT